MERRATWATLALVVVGMAAACSSSGRRAESAAHEMLRLAGSREATPPRDGSEVFVIDTLAAPPERLFAAARHAYESIGIPFSHHDADALGLGGFIRVLGDLMDERPSTWVDCGRGATAESYADSYVVSMAVATRVMAVDEERSTLETVVRARAQARDVSSDLLQCRSFGTFERRIAALVREHIAN